MIHNSIKFPINLINVFIDQDTFMKNKNSKCTYNYEINITANVETISSEIRI